jgi:glutamate dehydrogenase/leucine dehydrogenase
MIAAREATRRFNMNLPNAKVVVQGFGNVGYHAARILESEGHTIIGLSDVRGGIYNPNGIKVADAYKHLQMTGSCVGLSGTESVTNAELLELPCDILVPAALENQITEANADRIKAKLIVEGANGPTTPEADRILESRGVTVIPDILANAGGVIVSYFEWVQDLQSHFWSEDHVRNLLEQKLVTTFGQAFDFSQQHNVDMRIGTYALAVNRVARATELRGIYP